MYQPPACPPVCETARHHPCALNPSGCVLTCTESVQSLYSHRIFVELPNSLTVVMRRTPSVLIPICRHRGLHARVSGSSSCIFEHLGLPADTPRSEVRRRYLEAALRTHPDHCLDADAATRMAVLQTAWESYRRSDARRRRTTSQTGGAPAEGFATFGVGCSFADSEQESAERAEIITMASRGMMNPRPLSESKCVTADTAAARHV
jgi:hypothetical protein